MELIFTGFWNIFLDMAALTVCGITVVYIVGKRKRSSDRRFHDADEATIETIVRRAFDELVLQRPEGSFNRVIETVAAQQVTPKPPAFDKPAADGDFLVSDVRPTNGVFMKPEKKKPSASESRDPKSMRIYRFSASGMSVKKISDKLGVPRCEVELITKFRQRESSRCAAL
jgi:hypothetical protein